MKRNRPIFAIGVITAIVFAVIIVIGQATKSGPNLKNTPGTYDVTEREVDPNENQNNSNTSNPNAIVETPQVPEVSQQPKKILPILQMRFTQYGFEPATISGQEGQTLKWTNETDKKITLVELIEKNKAFPDEIVIEPLASFELTLEGYGFWTFEEKETEMIGRVLITR